jgi:hypothetical protein
MRIWDVAIGELDDQHLLGEHSELHALWTVLQRNSGGYQHHPETRRWRGHRPALWRRHEEQVAEMARRGFCHRSPLLPVDMTGESDTWPAVDPADLDRQRERLRQAWARQQARQTPEAPPGRG